MPDTTYRIAQPDGSERQAGAQEIEGEIKRGTITADTPLWRPSWLGWRKCGTLPEFEPFFKQVCAPPPSPYRGASRKHRKRAKKWMWIVPLCIIPLLVMGVAIVADKTDAMFTKGMWQAVDRGDAKMLSECLARGADPNEHNGQYDGITPLMAACYKGDAPCVKTLLKYGADVSDTTLNKTGYEVSAMLFAVSEGRPDCLELLVGAGANVNRRDRSSGETLLMKACEFGQPECVKILIDAGANVHAREKHGLTALDIAEDRGELVCAKLLRAAGADE